MLPIRLSGAGGALNDFGYHNGSILCVGGYRRVQPPPSEQLEMLKQIDAFDPLASPGWFASADLVEKRHHPMTVLLPDGQVAVIGGHDSPTQASPPLHRVEYVNLRSNAGSMSIAQGTHWDPFPHNEEHRGYHAVALLLPDGRVFVGSGKDGTKTVGFEKANFRILSPPYMQGPRPQILAIGDKDLKRQGVGGDRPTTTGLSVLMPTQSQPSEAVMMALGSMTHSYDMAQRYVEVAISNVVPGTEQLGQYTLDVTTPPQAWTPPGYYMLFVLDQNQVPSPSVIVHLK